MAELFVATSRNSRNVGGEVRNEIENVGTGNTDASNNAEIRSENTDNVVENGTAGVSGTGNTDPLNGVNDNVVGTELNEDEVTGRSVETASGIGDLEGGSQIGEGTGAPVPIVEKINNILINGDISAPVVNS